METDRKSLAELKRGESGTISGFTDGIISLKLMEMGCLPGSTIKMNYAAPLGDPISYDVAGYNLSLRLSEAACILISE
jgi:ferrous iron transport protein A